MATEEFVRKIAREYVNRLSRSINVERALLTGSWARGSYLEDSDVDLIIVSDDFEKMGLPDRLVYLQKSWKNKIPLEAFGYTTREFQRLRKQSTYVKDAVRHGVPLTSSSRRAWKNIKAVVGKRVETQGLVSEQEIQETVSKYRHGKRQSS